MTVTPWPIIRFHRAPRFRHCARCPDRNAKTRVLKEMIFPNCEKLGQTIIFVRTREAARTLHSEMESEGYKCTSIQVSQQT